MSGLSPTTGISGGVSATSLTGTLPVTNGGTGATTAQEALVNLGLNTANHLQSGQVYSSWGISNQAGGALAINTTYCCPFINTDDINGVTKLVMRIQTAGVGSNVKMGVATLSGTTATMISDLNPTGVPTTTLNTTIQGTISALNFRANKFYMLIAIGNGTMPTWAAVTNGSGNMAGITGATTADFGSTFYSGWTSATNTYAGGFASSFPVTKVSTTTIPFMGVLIP